MKLSVRTDYKQAMREFTRIERRQLPYATSVGLNNTADRCNKEVRKEIRRLHVPTKFTLNAFRVIRSSKRKLTAYLEAKPIQAAYLMPLYTGGTETRKHIVPGKHAKINRHGNLPRRASKAKRTFNIGNQVWKRIGKGKGSRIEMVGHFPAKRTYRKMFQFEKAVEIGFNRWFSYEWNKAFRLATATAR